MNTYIYIHIQIKKKIYIYTNIHICIKLDIYIYINLFLSICVSIHLSMYIYTTEPKKDQDLRPGRPEPPRRELILRG